MNVVPKNEAEESAAAEALKASTGLAPDAQAVATEADKLREKTAAEQRAKFEKWKAHVDVTAAEYGELYRLSIVYGEELLSTYAYGVWQVLLYLQVITNDFKAANEAEAMQKVGDYITEKLCALFPKDDKGRPMIDVKGCSRGDIMAFEVRSGKAVKLLIEVYANGPESFRADLNFSISLANQMAIYAGQMHREMLFQYKENLKAN